MKVTSVSVRVQKMFSDGNYGHQSAEVSYTAEVGENEDQEQVTVVLLARATAQVRVQLGESETLNIRRAINPKPRLCNYCNAPLGDWDHSYHKACDAFVTAERDRKRAEQNAEWAARQNAALDEEERADGSDLSEQEVEWLPRNTETLVAQGPSDDR